MSIDEGDYGRNSTHPFEAGGDSLAGRLRPGATVRIPLDDDTGADLAIGLSLEDSEGWLDVLEQVSADEVMAAARRLDRRQSVTGWLMGVEE
jgi:hypothetical protein